MEDPVLELQQATDQLDLLHPDQAPEVAPEFVVEDIGLAPPPAGLQYAGEQNARSCRVWVRLHCCFASKGPVLATLFRHVDMCCTGASPCSQDQS